MLDLVAIVVNYFQVDSQMLKNGYFNSEIMITAGNAHFATTVGSVELVACVMHSNTFYGSWLRF